MDDLDHATVTAEQAVALTPNDHPNRAKYPNNLANMLQSRFETTRSMNDLDRTILMNEQETAVVTALLHQNICCELCFTVVNSSLPLPYQKPYSHCR